MNSARAHAMQALKYCLCFTRVGVSTFCARFALLEESVGDNHSVFAEERMLADCGFLVLADGRAHVCYAREVPAGRRLSN